MRCKVQRLRSLHERNQPACAFAAVCVTLSIVHLRLRLQEVEGRPIAEYLALPVDEYNMLDSSIVERVPGKERTFRLTFPFREWFRINLKPQVVLRVEPDVEHARVHSFSPLAFSCSSD